MHSTVRVLLSPLLGAWPLTQADSSDILWNRCGEEQRGVWRGAPSHSLWSLLRMTLLMTWKVLLLLLRSWKREALTRSMSWPLTGSCLQRLPAWLRSPPSMRSVCLEHLARVKIAALFSGNNKMTQSLLLTPSLEDLERVLSMASHLLWQIHI